MVVWNTSMELMTMGLMRSKDTFLPSRVMFSREYCEGVPSLNTKGGTVSGPRPVCPSYGKKTDATDTVSAATASTHWYAGLQFTWFFSQRS